MNCPLFQLTRKLIIILIASIIVTLGRNTQKRSIWPLHRQFSIPYHIENLCYTPWAFATLRLHSGTHAADKCCLLHSCRVCMVRTVWSRARLCVYIYTHIYIHIYIHTYVCVYNCCYNRAKVTP